MSNTKALVKTRRVGGSLIVTLPKEMVEAKKIKEGEILEITVNKVKIEGFGLLKGIGSFTLQDELKPHE